MIEKQLLQNLSKRFGIRCETLERDYVMNLILDSFIHVPSAANGFFFKGGACVHKCFSRHMFDPQQPVYSYFTQGRFSNDIDLTIVPQMMDEEALHSVFQEVKEYLYDRHGLIINQFSFQIHNNSKQLIEDREKMNCRGYIHFEGPLYNPKFNSPALRFDITADESLLFPPYKRIIYNPYANEDEETILLAKTYSLQDLFAEKVRALFERCSPRDIYDLSILLKNPEMGECRKRDIGLSVIKKFALKKMDYHVSISDLQNKKKNGIPLIENCSQSWQKTFQRQVAIHPEFSVYIKELPYIVKFAQQCIQEAETHYIQPLKENPQESDSSIVQNLFSSRTDTKEKFEKLSKEMLIYEMMRGRND